MSQLFTITGENMHAPSFDMSYEVDFIDPHDDPWNRFSMEVRDLETNTILASEYFFGNMGDLVCARRVHSWNQDLGSHRILVTFNGSRGYNDTRIRVRNISLNQSLY